MEKARMAWTSISARAQVDASQIARLVHHQDDDLFDSALLDMLHDIAPVAEVNGFSYAERDRDPKPVGWHGWRGGTALRVDRYTRGFHRFDPTLHSLPNARRNQETLIHLLTAESVGNDAYRKTCFEDPSFSQKISIAHGDEEGDWTILNVYFGEPCSSPGTIQKVIAFGALVSPFLRRRAKSLDPKRPQPGSERVDDRLARRLQRRFPTLTERERSVCALTMIGKSSGEIATTLGIKPGTVLTYRRRAYERLGISSAASLVAEIL
jgi:DNA-binding CsgD family transcriptional regulator